MKKYRRHTQATVTFSVTVDEETKASLKARADRLFAGNMSALITELGREAERAEAVAWLVAHGGGSTLTDARRDEIDRELEEGWRHARAQGRLGGRRPRRRAA